MPSWQSYLIKPAIRLQRAREAGIPVELEVWPNMIHSWQTFGRRLPEARQARARIARFIHSHAPGLIPSAPV